MIAPEFRIFQLLRAHYQATRQMRALDFGVVPEEGRAERRRLKGKQVEKPAEPPPELIDENAFNEIYNQVVRGKTGPIAVKAERAPEPPAKAAPARTRAEPSRSRRATAAPPPPARPPPIQEVEEEILEALPEDAILQEPAQDAMITDAVRQAIAAAQPADAPEPPLKKVSWDDVPATPPPPKRDESPLDFKQALRALDGVSDCNAIAHIVLRASRNKAERALLLQVQGGVALGWDGLGEGTEHASQVAMPLATESAFSLVVKTRSHYLGPLEKTPANIRFLATLGKKVPLSALIFPILHRGRVSHMLYLDNGHRQQAPTDVGEMLILSQRIGQTVDALVERTRKAARA